MVVVTATPKPVVDVEAVAEAVKHGPVTVQAGGRDAFVAVEPGRFQQLEAADRARREAAWAKLDAAMDRIATAAALTPEEVAALEREIVDED